MSSTEPFNISTLNNFLSTIIDCHHPQSIVTLLKDFESMIDYNQWHTTSYLMVVLFIRYMRPKIHLCGTLLFLEQLMFYNYRMRYIIAAKLRKLKKGKFHCASGRLNSLLCTVAASSFIKFLATDWLFPDKYGDASSCDSMHFSVTMTQAVGGGVCGETLGTSLGKAT